MRMEMIPHVVDHTRIRNAQNFSFTDDAENHVVDDEAGVVEEMGVSASTRID